MINWNSNRTNMIAKLELTRREIPTGVFDTFRWSEILLSLKMVLKYRDREISSLEDIQNLTAKELREILRSHSESTAGIKADLRFVDARRAAIEGGQLSKS